MSDDTVETEGGESPKEKKKGKGNLLPAVVLALGIVGGGYFMGGSGGETAAEEPEPPAGEVATMEPLSLNLADGHFLKVGIALQLTEEVPLEEFGEGQLAKAKDLLIDRLAGRQMEELASPEGRAALKEELSAEAKETFHDEVLEVYFTDFVMQ